MPAVSKLQAAEKLAKVVEMAKDSDLLEIYAELFPETPPSVLPTADSIAERIRSGLKAEELVDLWNVVFPHDHHVWYDEESSSIRYNEEMVGYAD